MVAQAAVPLTAALCVGGYIDVPALDSRVLRVPLKQASTQYISTKCLCLAVTGVLHEKTEF